ncbi:MAG: hypothetical protein AAGA91_04845 [Pseudomonadota bacterium]
MSRKFPRITTLLKAIAVLFVASSVWFLWILRAPPPMPFPDPGGVFKNVVLILPGERRSPPVDIVIEGKRILAVTPTQEGQVNGYVLPGLVDAHVHGPILPLPGHDALFALLYLYHGITLVREAAGDAQLRNDIAAGKFPGPIVLTCGPFLDGEPPDWRGSLVVVDEASARSAVTEVIAGAFDCIKVYNNLTTEASAAIHLAAREAGLPVIGHVPWRQDFADAHIDDLQHVVGWAPFQPDDASIPHVRRLLGMADLDQERIDWLVQRAADRDFQLTPTLITLHRKFSLGDADALAQRPSAALLPRFYRQQLWHPSRGLVSARLLNEADHRQFETAFAQALSAVGALHEAGIELHSGTDSPAEFIVPGAGLWEELRLLTDAGLSPEQALAVSTVGTRKRLLPTAEAPLSQGALADFVVFSRDPTEDLARLDSLSAVVVEGRIYSREQMEQTLRRYQAWFNSPAYRRVTETMVGLGLGLINTFSGSQEPTPPPS